MSKHAGAAAPPALGAGANPHTDDASLRRRFLVDRDGVNQWAPGVHGYFDWVDLSKVRALYLCVFVTAPCSPGVRLCVCVGVSVSWH
mgnify:CR=1 FL=1